jgi:hypothetical protein
VILFFPFAGRKEKDKSMIATMLNSIQKAWIKKINARFYAVESIKHVVMSFRMNV